MGIQGAAKEPSSHRRTIIGQYIDNHSFRFLHYIEITLLLQEVLPTGIIMRNVLFEEVNSGAIIPVCRNLIIPE